MGHFFGFSCPLANTAQLNTQFWILLRMTNAERRLTPLESDSESELPYDWRFTASQLVLAISPLRLTTSNFIFQWSRCSYSPYVRVCRLQLLLVFASAVILRSESRGTRDHCILSQIHSPNLEGQLPVYISPRNRVAHYIPRHWVPFSSSPMARRNTVEIFDTASTRDTPLVRTELNLL
jgi:hypothetical protein